MTHGRGFRSSRKFAMLCVVVALGGCSGGGNEQDLGPMIQTELPFAYTVGPKALHISTAGGTVYVHLGAYGAHFTPHTGHASGDLKSNLVGFLVPNLASLTELAGDGDGICESGETCGFPGGTNNDNIRTRIPVYAAPMAGSVRRVTMNALPGSAYFDGVPHWEIELSLNPRYGLRFGHLGRIAPSLRDKILAATGINTDTYSGPVGHVLNGGAIPVAASEALAHPQVFALPVSGHPGYYRGGGTFPAVPWAQMEFTVLDHSESADVCVYELLDPARKAAVQLAMDADIADTRLAAVGTLLAEALDLGRARRAVHGVFAQPARFRQPPHQSGRMDRAAVVRHHGRRDLCDRQDPQDRGQLQRGQL